MTNEKHYTFEDLDEALGLVKTPRDDLTVIALFREVGFSEAEATKGTECMRSGRYFGFEDVATSLRSARGYQTSWRISESKIREVAARAPDTQQLLEHQAPTRTQPLQEAALVEAGAIDAAGSFPVRFISEGWGSAGYYSDKVLKSAVSLFAEGTPMFFDHATASEKLERPIRSVKDIAATITEAGKYNPAARAIDGRATLIPGAYRETVKALKGTIGLSINGGGTFSQGTAQGRSGRIVESLDEITSVDFVTKAGRGGRILS